MKAKILMSSIGAAAVLAAGVAFAEGPEVVTRSVEEAHADLIRTFKNPGGPPAGQIRSRTPDECYADLVRDWDGRLTKKQGTIVGVASEAPVVRTRSSEAAYKDMMRIW